MGLRVIFGAIITVALCTWCGLLYSVFASEISQPNPPDPCAGVARVLWSSRVVLRTETVPAAIHVGADGRIAEVRRLQAKDGMVRIRALLRRRRTRHRPPTTTMRMAGV